MSGFSLKSTLLTIIFLLSCAAQAHHHDSEDSSHHTHGSMPECSEMEVWDYSKDMCMPLAMAGMPMKMFMFHYDAFLTQTFEQGPRGRTAFSVPNMFMADIGSSVGDRQYLNFEFMGTYELWTFPKNGYPELLQIGEENADHEPYLDAQHPHSSPIMGLTFSDTITLKDKNHLKVFLAPRGSSTDGPVAFMHRPTGAVNPDAPLGHHVGQDVGHITSTVVGGSLGLGGTTIEASAFNGTEPEPTKVDLPLGELNSYSGRWIQEFNEHFYGMASAAYIKNPEPHVPSLDHIWRYSASLYNDYSLNGGWSFHNALIWGAVNNLDETSSLQSWLEEFLFQKNKKSIWSRFEYLQRTAAELEIPSLDPNKAKWVTALTLGYTHNIARWDFSDVGIGSSITKDFLPSEFRNAYGGDQLTAKIFVRLGGMTMENY